MRAGWEAAGLKASGSGKARTGTLIDGELRLSSTLNSPRGSNILLVTVNLVKAGEMVGSDLAVLAAELLRRSGAPLRVPPYPRPSALSAADAHWYAARIAELLRDVAAACGAVPPPA